MIDPVASTTAASAATTTSGASKSDDVSKGFEKLLLQQLSQEMMKTVSAWNEDSDDGEGGSSDALGGAYASMLPDALTNAVESASGLGLDLGLGLGKASS
jgi:hypothetical protein